MKTELLEIIYMIVLFSVFTSGFLFLLIRAEIKRKQEQKEHKKLL